MTGPDDRQEAMRRAREDVASYLRSVLGKPDADGGLTDAEVDAVLTRAVAVDSEHGGLSMAGTLGVVGQLVSAVRLLRLLNGTVTAAELATLPVVESGWADPPAQAVRTGKELALARLVRPFTDEQARLYLLLRDQGRCRREALLVVEGVFGICLLDD